MKKPHIHAAEVVSPVLLLNKCLEIRLSRFRRVIGHRAEWLWVKQRQIASRNHLLCYVKVRSESALGWRCQAIVKVMGRFKVP
jgi:hypothetical protein